MATFSLVASAWKSTMMMRAFARTASISFSTTANGSSMGVMKTRPMTLTMPTGRPSPDSATHEPRPGAPAG